MNYCNQCGSTISRIIPETDDRERFVCESCGYIHYQNPRIIVATLPCYEDKVLLCKRAIEPRFGLWTLPGGFLENDETTHEGAIRETREEACTDVDLLDIYSMYNLPHINQVHIFFRAEMQQAVFSAGTESLEVRLFSEPEIPWNQLAFIPVAETLKHYFQDRKSGRFPMHCGEIRFDPDSDSRIIKTL